MLRLLSILTLLAITACSKDESGVTKPFTNTPPTVTLEDTDLAPTLARITWRVQGDDGRVFKIERRYQSNPWKPLLRLKAVAGLLVVEDPSVQIGQSYSYRVGVGNEYQAEVTITIPTP
jgi:hypothetical protein